MTPEILAWAASVRQRFPCAPGRTLEIGSFNVNGSVRPLFTDATEYIGTDMRYGPGVDLVVLNSDLLSRFGAGSFDTIICCECLEHDIQFMRTVEQIHGMLKSGGRLVITTPAIGFPYHGYPFDYWRFTEDAYRQVFFNGLRILEITHLNDHHGGGRDMTVAALGEQA